MKPYSFWRARTRSGAGSLTPSELLTQLKTVDGNGSGLDADQLNGQQESAFALLTGRTNGQTLIGGNGVTDALTLQGTSGNGTATSAALHVKVGNDGASEALTILNNQHIGCGLSPTYTLDVQGATTDTIISRFGRENSGFESLVELRSAKTLFASGDEVGRGAIRLIDTISNRTMELGYYAYGGSLTTNNLFEFFTQGISVRNFTGDASFLAIRDTTDSNDLRLNHDGTYGTISTTGPTPGGIKLTSATSVLTLGNAAAQTLCVQTSATDVVGRALTVTAGDAVAGTSVDNVVGGNLVLKAGVGTGTGASTISFQTGTTLTTGKTLQTASTKMTILGNGNVGIGVSPGNFKLEVAGTAVIGGAGITGANVGTLTIAAGQQASNTSLQLGYYTGSFNASIWALRRMATTNTLAFLDIEGGDSGDETKSAYLTTSGRFGIGTATPTARLHLPAGSATASTAPIKMVSGPLLTAPEAGAIEFLTDRYYATITTGTARQRLLLSTRPVTAVTTTAAPTATDSHSIYTNEGDSDGATITLPSAAAGLQFTFAVQAAQTVTVTAGAGDTIRIASSVTAAAGSITCAMVGSTITVTAINATEWFCTAAIGTWTI